MLVVEKDGFKFIGGLVVLMGLSLLFGFWPASLAIFIIMVAVALFFRETKPNLNFDGSQIVSPASGRVIDIQEVFEPLFLKTRALRVSIFMSLLDEHINYAPVTGKVAYLVHREGGFKRAYLEAASNGNESQMIGFRNEKISCLMKQIAGVIARRIVCRCRVEDSVKAGEKVGLIRFGSRVELFLPLSIKMNLKPGQKVRGGFTIMGVIA